MSTTVDNRVVRMTFDNAQFERGIKETQKSLTEFEKQLKMEGATAGFDNISKAADRVNLSAIGTKAKKESDAVKYATDDTLSSINSITKSADGVDLNGISKSASSAASNANSALGEVSKTVSTVDDAADQSDFSGISNAAWNALNSVNDATMSINMSSINDSVSEAARGFNLFEEVAIGAMRRVGEYISDFITGGLSKLGSTIKSYAIDPIKEGFHEYETQIGSIQTIMANTDRNFDSADDIKDVNDALNELNTFADETIYKFSDMTEAIGTFTAAGLDLEQAVDAVQGSAAVAALSGASKSDYHRVLPQLSQALSSGTVTMQDWRSVETAHMASAKFVEAIADMAIHMAKVNKAGAEAADAGQKILDKELTMREALNKTDNKDMAGWFSSDILTETLRTFTFDIRSASADEIKAMKEYLANLGYQADEMDAIFDRAATAMRSATEVRTWSQMWDTIKESIGSNWTGVWTNLLGDFRQATNTFTFISQKLTGIIDGMFAGIVNTARTFNASGAYKLIFGDTIKNEQGNVERVAGALDSIAAAIEKPLKAIGDAFNAVFGMDEETLSVTLVSFAGAFKDFADSLVISDDAATGISQIFEGLFSILDVGIQVVLDIGAAFAGLLDTVRMIADPLIDIALTMSGQVGKVFTWLHDRFLDIRAAVIEATKPIREATGEVKNLVSGFFDFIALPDKIQDFGDAFIGILDAIWGFIDLPTIIRDIANAIGKLFEFLGNLFGFNSDLSKTNDTLESTGEKVSWFDQALSTLTNNPIFNFFKTLVDHILKFAEHIGQVVLDILHLEEVGYKLTLPNIFKQLIKYSKDLASTVAKKFPNISKIIDRVQDAFSKVIEYFAKGKFKDSLNKVKQWSDGIIQNAKNLYNYLKNTPIGKSFGNIASSIKDGLSKFDLVGTTMNNLKTVFDNGMPAITNVIETGVNGITSFLAPIWEKSNSIPEFFVNLFVAIKEAIGKGLSNIKDAIVNFKPEDLFAGWMAVSNTISEIVASWFPNISDDFNNAMGGINSFFESTLGDAQNWGEVISNIMDNVGKAIESVPKKIGDKVNQIGTELGKWFGVINEKTAPLVKPFEDFSNHVTETLAGPATTAKNVVTGTSKGGLFGGIKSFFTSAFDNLANFFNTAGGKITAVFDTAANAIDSGSVTRFSELINTVIIGQLLNSLKQLVGSFKQLVGSFQQLSNSITKYFNRKNTETLSESVRNLAIALAIVAGSLLIISLIPDPYKAMNTLIGVAVVLTAMEIIVSLLNKWTGGGAGKDAINMAASLGVFGISLLVAMFSIERLSQFDWKKNLECIKLAIIALSAMSILTGIMSRIAGGGGKEMIKAAAGMVILTAGLSILPPVLERFMGIAERVTSYETFGQYLLALVTFAGTMVAMGGALKLAGTNAIKAGMGFIMLGAAMTIMINGLHTLKDANPDSLGVVLGGLAAILITFSVLAGKVDPKNTSKTATAMLKLGIAIGIMAYAISKLASNDTAAIGASVSGITAMMFVFYRMAKKVDPKTLSKASTAMLKFSVSVAIMAGSLWLLAGQKWEAIAAAGAGITFIIKALSSLIKSVGKTDLRKTGTGFLIMSFGVAAIAGSLAILANLDAGRVIVSAAAIDMVLLAMGRLIKLARYTQSMIKMGTGFLIMSVGIGFIAGSLFALADKDWKNLIVGALAIDAIISAFGKMSQVTRGMDLIATGQGFLIFSFGLLSTALALGGLAEYDWKQLGAGALSLISLVGAFGLLTKITNNLDAKATSEGFLVYATSMIILADALTFLTDIKPEVVFSAAGALSALVLAFGALAIMTKGADLVITGGGLVVYAAGVMMLADALTMLADMKLDNLSHGAGALAALALAFGVLTTLTGEGDLIATGGGLVVYAAGILILADALTILAGMKTENLIAASSALAGLAVSLALLANFSLSVDLVATGGGLIVYAVGVLILANALTTLAGMKTENLIAAASALAGLAVALGLLAGMSLSIDLVATGAGLIVYAAGVLILADALTMLNGIKWDNLVSAGIALGIVTVAFGALAMLTNGIDLLATAAAFDLFAIGIIGVSYALATVMEIIKNFPSFEQFYAIGYNIIGGIGKGMYDGLALLFETVTNIATQIINALTSALGIHSPSKVMQEEVGQYIPAGVAKGVTDNGGVITDALDETANNIIDDSSVLNDAIAGISDTDSISVPAEVEGSSNPLSSVTNGFSSGGMDLNNTLSGITDSVNLNQMDFNDALSGFGSTDSDMFSGLTNDIDLNGGDMLSSLGDISGGIDLNSMNINDSISGLGQGYDPNMFGGLTSDIATNGDGINTALTDITAGINTNGPGITDALGNLFGEGGISGAIGNLFGFGGGEGEEGAGGGIIESIKTGFGDFIAGIPDWIMNVAIPAAGQALSDFWAWFTSEGIPMIGQALSDFWAWFTTDGLRMIGEALSSFWNWFTTEGLPAIGEFISTIISKLGELLSQFWTWFTTEGLPMLGQALAGFASWAFNEGIPKLLEFLGTILSKLGEFAMKFLSWLGTDGLPMLGKALGDFWHWVTTEALPKLGEFILGIFAKIGELPGKLWNWIQTDGLKAVGDALHAIIEKAGEIGGMILDWAKGIPGYIADGIKGIWDEITSAGADIARGIVEGLAKPVMDIAQGIHDFGGRLVGGVKDFFGIQSPSKLMRDEVGRYIPEGIAEGMLLYSDVAEKAGEDVGNATVNGVNSSLDSARYGAVNPTITPTITPVLNMGSFNQNLDAYRASMATLPTNSRITVDAQSTLREQSMIQGEVAIGTNFESLLALVTDRFNNILENNSTNITNQLNSINDTLKDGGFNTINNELSKMNNNIEQIRNNVDTKLLDIQEQTHKMYNKIPSDSNIYMDTGALVGALAPEMDSVLGFRRSQASRGVI